MVTQKEIFFQYILNERDRLERDVIELRQSFRMKNNIDQSDCLELALAIERFESFRIYSAHAIAIFELACPADYEAQIINIDFTAYKKAAEDLRRQNKAVKK